jgi:outer membrane protein assembly factor BamB
MSARKLQTLLPILLLWPLCTWGGTKVLTRSYDNARTGANTSETTFTRHKIITLGLKRVFSLSLTGDDPRIEAQPLYLPDVMMSDGKRHDVLYAFSMSNMVWAFDSNTGQPIWPHPVSLGPPFLPRLGDPVDTKGINRSFGILSTPVIDPDSETIYVVYWLSDDATHQSRQLRLSALNVSDGQPQHGKETSLPIQASQMNSSGQVISLNQVQKQRAALLLTPLVRGTGTTGHKMLYVAFTGAEEPPADSDPRKANHGWVVAFDVDDWKQAAAWLSTPSTFGGGIWQASQGPAADDQGNVYLMTSNGGYLISPSNKDFNGVTDFAESFVRLSMVTGADGTALKLMDWFSPFRDSVRKNWTSSDVEPFPEGYDYSDQDLGSAGPVLLPETNLLVGAGKDGVLYVLDRNHMGQAIGDFSKLKGPPVFFTYDPDRTIAAFQNASPTGNLDFQPMQGVKTHHLHGSPVYWKSRTLGPMLFAWGENGNLRAYSVNPSGEAKFLARGAEFASANLADPENDSLGGMPGAMLAVSSSGEDNGIVWATTPAEGDANAAPVPGMVLAYDATEFAKIPNHDGVPRLRKLWQSTGFTYSKFCPPVVADGKLFVPTYDGRIDVYMLEAPHRRSSKIG